MQYLNFIYLRLKNGHEISEEEERRTYKYYVEYCQENDIDFHSIVIFFRELRKLGINTLQKVSSLDPDKRVRKREFKIERLRQIVHAHGGFNSNAVHAGLVELGGETYQVIVKLLKISPDHSVENKT